MRAMGSVGDAQDNALASPSRIAPRCRGESRVVVEWKGIEPSTFALRTRRSPS